MFCPECGSKQEDGVAFCGNCGADLRAFANQGQAAPAATATAVPMSSARPTTSHIPPQRSMMPTGMATTSAVFVDDKRPKLVMTIIAVILICMLPLGWLQCTAQGDADLIPISVPAASQAYDSLGSFYSWGKDSIGKMVDLLNTDTAQAAGVTSSSYTTVLSSSESFIDSSLSTLGGQSFVVGLMSLLWYLSLLALPVAIVTTRTSMVDPRKRLVVGICFALPALASLLCLVNAGGIVTTFGLALPNSLYGITSGGVTPFCWITFILATLACAWNLAFFAQARHQAQAR